MQLKVSTAACPGCATDTDDFRSALRLRVRRAVGQAPGTCRWVPPCHWVSHLRRLRRSSEASVVHGVLVVSDAHAGLVDAIRAVLPGASWQRCRTHCARNRLSKVPKSAQPWVAALLRTVFEQPDADAVHAETKQVLEALDQKFPKAAEPPRDLAANLVRQSAGTAETRRSGAAAT